MFCGTGKWMGNAKNALVNSQDYFAKYMYWFCFDLSCNQELVSTQGFHMAKHCDRVFSSKVKQIMESQGHPLFWEGTKFQNENVYYMYCLDYIQSVKSILLHKPYLIPRLPPLQGGPFLVCWTKQNTALWQTMPPIAGPAQKLEFDICRLFRSGSPKSHACGGRMCFTASPPITKHSSSLKHSLLLCYHVKH